MRAFRILLQVIFGLLSALVVFVFLRAPNADYVSNLGMLAFFVLIILVLGPWWPSQENIEHWSKKWKLQLPTDDTQVAIYIANLLGAAYGFYKAWDRYTNPTTELWRFEKTAYALAGTSGVVAFWAFLALACLAYGMSVYAKTRKA